MTTIRHHSDDLILRPERRDEVGDVGAVSELLHDLQLVCNPLRRAGDVDALEGDVDFGSRSRLAVAHDGRVSNLLRPDVVVVVVVERVDGLVDGREGA